MIMIILNKCPELSLTPPRGLRPAGAGRPGLATAAAASNLAPRRLSDAPGSEKGKCSSEGSALYDVFSTRFICAVAA